MVTGVGLYCVCCVLCSTLYCDYRHSQKLGQAQNVEKGTKKHSQEFCECFILIAPVGVGDGWA